MATAKTADLTVVGGAGHVGIPLVLSFAAKGLTVNVNDINEQTLATLRAGRVPFIENNAQPLLTKALADKRLFFTSRPSEISTNGPVIITISTPVDATPCAPSSRIASTRCCRICTTGSFCCCGRRFLPAPRNGSTPTSSGRAAISRLRFVPSGLREKRVCARQCRHHGE
jgi:hypothetical protein